jgi:hypothetical protein
MSGKIFGEKGLTGLPCCLWMLIMTAKFLIYFDIYRTVFAKNVGDDGVIKMIGLTKSIAVVAIDKHGNESKAFLV